MWCLVCWFWVIVGLGCGDVVFAGCGFGDTLGFLDLAWFGAALDLWVGCLVLLGLICVVIGGFIWL